MAGAALEGNDPKPNLAMTPSPSPTPNPHQGNARLDCALLAAESYGFGAARISGCIYQACVRTMAILLILAISGCIYQACVRTMAILLGLCLLGTYGILGLCLPPRAACMCMLHVHVSGMLTMAILLG